MEQVTQDNPDLIQAGDEIDFNGKKLMAIGQFVSGDAFKKSGLKYYIVNHKGVMGFEGV